MHNSVRTGWLTGQDAEKKYLGVWHLRVQRVENGLHSFGNLRSSIRVEVVCSDHEDDQLRLDAIKLAMGNAVQNVLSAIATDAVVEGVSGGVVLSPNVFSISRPSMSD